MKEGEKAVRSLFKITGQYGKIEARRKFDGG